MSPAPARPELTPEQVQALARALDLPLIAEDLAEVTHRLNAYLGTLGALATLPLADVEPVPNPPWLGDAG